MYAISYLVQHVDGSQQEIHGTAEDAAQFAKLTEQGFTGKALLDALITDDWAVPPSFVVITHRLTGPPVSLSVRYT
jgi:hypothetical protein